MTPDLSLATDLVCEKCGNFTFQEVTLFKKFSALVSGTGKAGIAPIPTFACVACGNINAEFLPNLSPVKEATTSDSAQLSLAL